MNSLNEKLVSTVLQSLPSVVTGFKYGGWSIDELALFIGKARGKPMTSSKAAQSVNAFRDTGSILWKEDRVRVCAMLMFGVECRRADERATRRSELQMSEEEIDVRICMAKGRYDGPNGPECRQRTASERM